MQKKKESGSRLQGVSRLKEGEQRRLADSNKKRENEEERMGWVCVSAYASIPLSGVAGLSRTGPAVDFCVAALLRHAS